MSSEIWTDDDSRFTMGLISDICEVLERHGYEVAAPRGYAAMLPELLRLAHAYEGKDTPGSAGS